MGIDGEMKDEDDGGVDDALNRFVEVKVYPAFMFVCFFLCSFCMEKYNSAFNCGKVSKG